jgi:hypothetical protein
VLAGSMAKFKVEAPGFVNVILPVLAPSIYI